MKRVLSRLAALAFAAGVIWLGAGPASGYVSIRIPLGNLGQALPTRWDLDNTAGRPNIANRRVRYEISDAGCADRAGFIGPINEFEGIQNSLSQWRNITESEIDFEFAGATTNAASNAGDNRNVIHWVSGNISSGVFAVTITTFTTATGDITDVDMELNDRDFTWDTVGPTAATGHIGRAIIENVVTHEAGHLIGLDHPSNSRSSLFFQSGPGLISSMSLEVDDRAPIIADYPSPDFADARLGSVSGSVDNGTPQFGVEVLLLDLANGRNVVGSVSEGTPGPFPLGSFQIENVPPGNYAVLCWPVNKSALGSYYSTAFTNFYPVIRGVPVGTAGVPTLAKVGPGGSVTGVNVTLPAPAQTPFEPNGTAATAKDIASGQAAVSTIQPSTDEDWFKFTTTQPNQQVRVRVMADVLGASLNPTLTMFGTNGTTVLVSPNFGDPAFMASANDVDSAAFDLSGPNFDAEITRTMGVPGTYFFRVASRQGVTTGHYLVFLEVDGTDTTADTNVSAISASTAGTPVGGAAFTVTVIPRNALGRDLNTTTFTVELLDATPGVPVVLDTITGTAPFTFNVAALGSSQVVKYGSRIGGNPISETVSVSHFSTVSTANSRVLALEKTITGNGYDNVAIRVELRDGSNNPFRDPAASVLVSTTLGTLNNGTANGATGIAGVYDPVLGHWRINLVAPTTTGTAAISATVGGNPIALGATVLVLQRANGTGGGGSGGGPGDDDDDDDNGSCSVGRTTSPLALLLLTTSLVAVAKKSVRRRSISTQPLLK